MDMTNIIINKTIADNGFFATQCMNVCVKAAKNFYNDQLRTYFIILFVIVAVAYALHHWRENETIRVIYEYVEGVILLAIMVILLILILMIRYV